MGNEVCPEGKELYNGLCYTPCPQGMQLDTSVPTVCRAVCLPPSTDSGLTFCYRNYYNRGNGHTTEEICRASGDPGAAENGCEKWLLLWYPKCNADYTWEGILPTVCSQNCTPGTNSSGYATCEKNQFYRGPGTVPPPQPVSWSTYAIIILILIAIIMVAIAVIRV